MPSSLAMLLPPALGSSPCPPVSVCGTGAHGAIAAFPGTGFACFPTRLSVRVAALPVHGGFSSRAAPPLAPVSSLPAHAPPMRPRSSGHAQYRNVHLSSIGYALRPRLRPRLTQGRSALPWKPWTFGRKDSHLALATHSGILSSRLSTASSNAASPLAGSLLYRVSFDTPRASVACFSPGHFRRGASRLVSCYALFERMAASEPTS